MSSKPLKACLIAHTHWDREWYLPVELYRFRLIKVFDRLRQVINEEPDYHSFFFDGQTIPLDDYLAVRPEATNEIRQWITRKKLRLGPFYVLHDEQLVSGESFVRNLLIGLEAVKALGGEASVGYLPDNFGHVSQTPQILRGFGLDNAVFWRGYKIGEATRATGTWRGADGSEVLAVLLTCGYSAFRVGSTEGPLDFTRADHCYAELKRRTDGDTLLFMHGIDHAIPHRQLSELVRQFNERYPDVEVAHSDFESYLETIRKQSHPYRLEGELLHAPSLEGTFSSRLWEKQEHRGVENELTAYAEPLSIMARLAGHPYPAADLRRAWKLLIQCQPHDSITGCHSDSVADDMRQRLRHSREIAGYLTEQALNRLATENFDEQDPAECQTLEVFNPLPSERNVIVRAQVFLPAGNDAIREIRVEGSDGAWVADILENERVAWPRVSDQTIPKTLVHQRVTLEFGPARLAPLGLTSFQYRVVTSAPIADNLVSTMQLATSPETTHSFLSASTDVLENEWVAVEVRPDASIRLTDKRNGRCYQRLHQLEAEPDAGNLYKFMPLAPRIRYRFVPESLTLLRNTPLGSALAVTGVMRVPAGVGADYAPSPNRVDCPVQVEITLKRGDPVVYFRTRIENHARNLCLRACFDTGLSKAANVAHTPFDIVPRPPLSEKWIMLGPRWMGANVTRYCAQYFTSIADEQGGVAILNRGLPEYTFHEGGSGSLTLLRGGGYIWGCTPQEFPLREYPSESGQELGEHVREYALLPHEGNIGTSAQLTAALGYNLPPRVYLARQPLKSRFSLALSPSSLVLSALKQSEEGNGIVLRFYNVQSEPQQGCIRLSQPVGSVEKGRLDETGWVRIAGQTQTFDLTVQPKEIVTLRLNFE